MLANVLLSGKRLRVERDNMAKTDKIKKTVSRKNIQEMRSILRLIEMNITAGDDAGLDNLRWDLETVTWALYVSLGIEQN